MDSKLEPGESYGQILQKLRLDIKAAAALSKTSERYKNALTNEIILSPDTDIRAFLDLVTQKRMSSGKRHFLIATGEIVFAALLFFFGLSILIPAFFVYSNPSEIIYYFQFYVNSFLPVSFGLYLMLSVDFLLSILMLIGAFSLIRRGSESLKDGNLQVTDSP